MSLARARLVRGTYGSSNTNDSGHLVHRRTQQLLYFECDIYTVNRTLLKAYEDFSEERANMLFEKNARKKVSRSMAHFLIDRISFERKGAFASKPFRKEVTYREIKYFFAWTERPEFFMFCVTDEKLRRKSYEIYRCDSTKDVHSVCALVFKATNDPQFILRNEQPVDVISHPLNEGDESLVSLDEESTSAILSQIDSNNGSLWIKKNSNSYDRPDGNTRSTYLANGSVLNEARQASVRESIVNFPGDRLLSEPVMSVARSNPTGSSPYKTRSAASVQPRAIDVYSFYDLSPALNPKRFPSWSSVSNDSTNRTNTFSRRETPSSQRDFSAQSGTLLVSEATSPFMSTPGPMRRATSQKIDTTTSPFEYTRHQFTSPRAVTSRSPSYANIRDSDGSVRKNIVIDALQARLKRGRMNNDNDERTQGAYDPAVLYASSESFFDQPLSSDGPLYMYVTYLESDSQAGGSSSLSRASTATGTSRTMLDDETTDVGH